MQTELNIIIDRLDKIEKKSLLLIKDIQDLKKELLKENTESYVSKDTPRYAPDIKDQLQGLFNG